MKNFLAIYIGSAGARGQWEALDEAEQQKRQVAGMQAWIDWAARNAGSIVDIGSPLGKTKRAAPDGVSDIVNVMAAYTVVRADSHEAAAKLFENHPHFTIFPGDSVEIMECLPLPSRG
jgi:hypothetical protein